MPDQASFLQGGELVLSSLFAFKETPEAIVDHIVALFEGGAAALGYKLGRFIDRLPEDAIRVADRLAFPLIELPVNLAWPDVMTPVLRQLLHDQSQLLEHTIRAHRELMEVALRGGGLQQILDQAQRTTGRDVLLFDNSFRLLAAASSPAAVTQVVVDGMVHEADMKRLKSSGLLRKMEVDRRPVEWRGSPGNDNTCAIRGMLFPVVCRGEIYGYLLSIDSMRQLSAVDTVAFEETSMVVALDLLKREAIEMASWQLEGDLLQDLIAGIEVSPADFARRARLLGFNPATGYRMYAIEPRAVAANSDEARSQLLKVVRRAIRQIAPALVAAVGERIAVFLPESSVTRSSPKAVAVKLLQNINRNDISALPRVGVGARCTDLGEVRSSYADACRALAVSRLSRPEEGVIGIDEIGVFDLLSQSARPDELRAFCERTTSVLQAYDRQNSGDLCETLAVFLDNHQRVKETAITLYIHRNTLTDRLAKIRKLTGLDFDDPVACMNWQVALRLPPLLDVDTNGIL